MKSQGYKRSEVVQCLYTKKQSDGSLLILIRYVDEMLIDGKHIHDVDALRAELHKPLR